MAETFDPYYKWLGIPPKDQPPHHYRLLGIELFEADREVIDAAANRLMGYLKDLAVGDETAYSQKLLNEIARARLCLLTKDKKAAYDQELREKLQSDAAAPPEGQQLPSPPTRSALPPAAPPPPGPAPAFEPPRFPVVDTAMSSRAAISPVNIVIRADEDEGEAGDETLSDRGRGDLKATLLWAAVGAESVIAIGLGILLLFLPRETSQRTAQPRPKLASTGTVTAPVLILVLTPEERSQVSAFLVDDVPQKLPPQSEYTLEPGRHRVVLRRPGYREVLDNITLVHGVRREYKPTWRPESPAATSESSKTSPMTGQVAPLPKGPASSFLSAALVGFTSGLAPDRPSGQLTAEIWQPVVHRALRRHSEQVLRREPRETIALQDQLLVQTPVGRGYQFDRLRGFLYPPEGGEFVFQLFGSGEALAYLQWSSPGEALLSEAVVNQPGLSVDSAPVTLEAGKPCYFEILHLCDSRSPGTLRLSWKRPSSRAGSFEVIPLACVAPCASAA